MKQRSDRRIWTMVLLTGVLWLLLTAAVQQGDITNPVLVALLGVLVSFVNWLLGALSERFGWRPPGEVLNLTLYLLAVPIAVVFMDLTFPTGGVDAWLDFLVVSLAPIMAFAHAIYNFILARLMNAGGEALAGVSRSSGSG